MRWMSEQQGAAASRGATGRIKLELDLDDGSLELELAEIGRGRYIGQFGMGDHIDVVGVERMPGQPAMRATWRRVWPFEDRVGPAMQWVLWEIVAGGECS